MLYLSCLQAAVAQLDFVKDVHREQRLSRSLAWDSELDPAPEPEQGGRRHHLHGSPKPCDSSNATHDPNVATHKRPGRLVPYPIKHGAS